ncbi:MAG: hypothetical protein ACFFDC_15015 [Promethearchaeota archaeon]
MQEKRHLVKLVTLGVPNHLKTEFIRKLTNTSGFSTGLPRSDIEWYFRVEQHGKMSVKFVVFDIYGMKLPFKASLYQGASGVIFVFSKAEKESFSQMGAYYQDYCAKNLSLPTYLIGFKNAVTRVRPLSEMFRFRSSIPDLKKKAEYLNLTKDSTDIILEEMEGVSRNYHEEDYNEVVSTTEAQSQATKMNAKYYEVNVFADFRGIEDIFQDIQACVTTTYPK